MAKIRSSSTNMGVLISENKTATYGAIPSDWTTATGESYRVPFTSVDIKAQDEILPESGEYTTLGAAQQPIRGRRFARGSITIEPVYDAHWFWLLFGHGFSTEDVVADEDIEASAELTLNTHGFDVSGGVSQNCDMAMRLYKNSWYETYSGLTCTRWVWEHASGQIPTVTMDWAGISAANPITTTVGTDFSEKSAPVDNRVKLTDLGRTDSDVEIGSTQGPVNITTLRIIGERSVDLDDPEFLQSLLTASRPGQQENRAVSLELEGTLESTQADAGEILPEYLADTLSKASIGYASSVEVATGVPYQIRFDFPSISWTAFAGDMTQLGLIPWTATGICLAGATSALASPFSLHTETPLSGVTDMRCLTHMDDTLGATAITTLGVSS